MLDRGFVPPGDLVDRHVEYGGDFLALGGAGCPTAENNRERAAFLQPAALGQLRHFDLMLAAEIGDRLRHVEEGIEERGASSKNTACNGLGRDVSVNLPMGCVASF